MGKRGRPRYPDVHTPREWEVLALLREGLTNEQIAERLGVTLHAARYHVSEILSKLGVATREEAAAWQPKEARLGPRWSIAFQIWLTAAAAVALIAVGVLAWGVSRGSGDDSQAGLALESPNASGSASESPTPTFIASTRPPVGSDVRAMQFVNLGFAWILTDSQLTRTQFIPAGEKIDIQTKDIKPPGVSIADIRGVHFLDIGHGWLVANGPTDSSNSMQLIVYRTSNGGDSWRSSSLGEPDLINAASASMPAYIDFLDSDTGWVVAKTVSGTDFSVGDLYRTDDGGVSWTKLSIPTGDPVNFADANNGWAAGGPTKGTLYVTHDGGASWQDASDITPLAQPAGPRAFGLPMAVDGGSRLLLPVTMTIPDNPSLFMLYSSTDEGDLWRQVAQTAIGGDINAGIVAPSYVFPNGRVIAIASNGGAGLVLPAGSTELLQFPITGLSGAIDVQFGDDKHGWALVTENSCAGFKTNCWSLNRIEQTDDGGRTWGPP